MDSPSDEEILDRNKPEESSTSEAQDIENTTEDSSPLEKSEGELSTLELIQGALKEESEESDKFEGSSEKDDKEEDKSKDESESEDEDSDEPSDDELKNWKPKTRKRFEQLQLKYRDEKTLREKAEVEAGLYNQYTQYLETNNISKDEANELFDIGAKMKNDPMAALKAITPYYNRLLEVTGSVLPNDLQERVSQGYITKEYAYELSQSRAQNQFNQNRNQQIVAQQERNHQEANQQLISNIQSKLAEIENSWKSEPDYKIKSTRIQDRVKLLWYEAGRNNTMPRTVEEAERMVKGVKAEVDNEFKKFRPRKPSVDTIDGGGSSNNLPEPKSTFDVINRTLGA